MRHAISGKRFGRNSGWRKATVRDIAKAALIHERICTTKKRAKEARKLVDRLITMGKKGTLAHKRRAFAILCDHQVVSDLFRKTAPRFQNRAGGYTRIIPLANRQGDNAELALLELTEKSEIMITKPKSAGKSKTKGLESSSVQSTESQSAVKEAKVEEKPRKTAKKQKTSLRSEAEKSSSTSDKEQKEPKDKGLSGFKKIFRRKNPNA